MIHSCISTAGFLPSTASWDLHQIPVPFQLFSQTRGAFGYHLFALRCALVCTSSIASIALSLGLLVLEIEWYTPENYHGTWKWTWKRRFLLETIIFRFHVNLPGCKRGRLAVFSVVFFLQGSGYRTRVQVVGCWVVTLEGPLGGLSGNGPVNLMAHNMMKCRNFSQHVFSILRFFSVYLFLVIPHKIYGELQGRFCVCWRMLIDHVRKKTVCLDWVFLAWMNSQDPGMS